MTISVVKEEIRVDLRDEDYYRRIGLILLATDLTSEHDFTEICRFKGLRIHCTRIAYENPVTPENLLAMGNGLSEAAALLVPEIPLQAIYFSCTSGSALLGDDRVQKSIEEGRKGVPVITPLWAGEKAFASLGAKKISVLTPYTREVAMAVGEYFAKRGLGVCNISYLGLEDDREMARIRPESILAAAKNTMAADADALFISCTALPSAQCALQIERELGRPVVTSNQAAAWQALQYAGIEPVVAGYGSLLS